MGAFADGFSQGRGIVNDSLDRAQRQQALDLQVNADKRAGVKADQETTVFTQTQARYNEAKALLDSLNPAPTTGLKGVAGALAPSLGSPNLGGDLPEYGQDAPPAAGAQPTSLGLEPKSNAPTFGSTTVSPPTQQAALSSGPTELQRADIWRRVAAINQDPQAYAQAQAMYETHDKRRIASEVMKMGPDELQSYVANGLNGHNVPLLYAGKDANGYTILKTTSDGVPTGEKFSLNESELRQMALSGGLAKGGYGDDALHALSAAHKDIGEHMDKHNLTMKEMALVNNDAKYKNDTQATKLEIAGMRAEVAYAKLAYARTGKEMSPEDATKLNQMQLDIENETDDKKRAKLTGDFKREYGVVMGKMGKVISNMDDKAPKPDKPIAEADIDAVISHLSKDPEVKALPYEQQRSKALGIIRGDNSGGLSAWNTKPPGTKDKEPAVKMKTPPVKASGLSHQAVDAPPKPLTAPVRDPVLDEIDTRLRSPLITDRNRLGALLERNEAVNGPTIGTGLQGFRQ